MPRTYADGAELAAITEALRPYVESETNKAVSITYWRDEILLKQVTLSSATGLGWWHLAPVETTHLTITVPAEVSQ